MENIWRKKISYVYNDVLWMFVFVFTLMKVIITNTINKSIDAKVGYCELNQYHQYHAELQVSYWRGDRCEV